MTSRWCRTRLAPQTRPLPTRARNPGQATLPSSGGKWQIVL